MHLGNRIFSDTARQPLQTESVTLRRSVKAIGLSVEDEAMIIELFESDYFRRRTQILFGSL